MAELDGFHLDPVRLAGLIRPKDLVIIGSPNNPTGAMVEASVITGLAGDFPEADFLIDEAFLDFVPDGESVGGRAENIHTLNSLTKFYAIPGLRLGFGVFPERIAGLLRENLPPWTVNSLAQVIGTRALQDRDYQDRTRAECIRLRQRFRRQIGEFADLQVYPATANYLFLHLSGRMNSRNWPQGSRPGAC